MDFVKLCSVHRSEHSHRSQCLTETPVQSSKPQNTAITCTSQICALPVSPHSERLDPAVATDALWPLPLYSTTPTSTANAAG